MAEKNIREQTYENFLFPGFPVIPEKTTIKRDEKSNKSIIQFYFLKIASKSIEKIHLRVDCFDENNNLITTIPDHVITISEQNDAQSLKSKNTLDIESSALISNIDFLIKKVVFSGNNKWINEDNEKGIEAEPPKPIDLPNELKDFLIKRESQNLNILTDCMFAEYKNYWRCSCKMLNEWNVKVCCSCGARIDNLRTAFSESYLSKRIQNQSEDDYNEGISYQYRNDLENLQKAIEIFSKIKGYKDSAERIETCQKKINEIKSQINAEKTAKRKKVLKNLFILLIVAVIIVFAAYKFIYSKFVVPQKKYDAAMVLYNNGQYEDAYNAFNELITFKDSRVKKAELFHEYIKTKEKGDTIQFGTQEWIILEKKDKRIHVLAKETIGTKAYHTEYVDVTWEESAMRAYLNNEFYNKFSDEEKMFILETVVSTKDNSKYKTKGGNTTKDYIYLLSIDEIKSVVPKEIRGTGTWWWTRSPGQHNFDAAVVSESGDIRSSGQYVNYIYGGIRPAMWLSTDTKIE